MSARATWTAALGSRLAAARDRAGLTLAAAAARSGLRLNTVSRWELGRQCPSAYDLARHCAALGVSVARLLPPAHDSAVRDQEHDQPAALG